MFGRLPTVAVIFALLAAAIHVLFFVLESVLFRRPFGHHRASRRCWPSSAC